MSKTILDTIGNTPLVEIRRLNPKPKVRILAKLESTNPGGSVKDRPALFMIEAGERSGELTAQKTVIEATSGNTGIGLALVCAIKGYRLLLTMSEDVSMERQKILRARGADILLTPGHLGTDGAIEESYRMVRENPEAYFLTDQYNNPANWKSHYYGTAEEIWRQTNAEVSIVIATIGTTGTIMGISRRLKELNPDIQIVGVEPYLGHKIQGLKNMKEAYCPEIYEKSRLDEKINIEDEAAFEMARTLARQEGIFVGMSSGAAMEIARQKAAALNEGTIVVIFPDGGERYLSTALFTVREKVALQFYNTLTRTKESFEPHLLGRVSMYSCGPTMHARMQVGECRHFVFADLLSRYLEYRGYSVKHIVNITDFDDKTIRSSEIAGETHSDFTQKYIHIFKKDLELLGIKCAAKYPLASEHIDDMIELADKLVKKGAAYEKLRSLYFSISRISDYGQLSGIDINKIKLGATVDLDDYEKDNPRDFTLLKRAKLSELKRGLYVKTEWGNVRPSWHIQCAAISMKYMGDGLDIHTGSRQLSFPHHENEIAIAKALIGKPIVKYWLHCERVLFEEKNRTDKAVALNLMDLTDMGYSGREIRFWLLSTHYRKPITFSRERLEFVKRSLKRLDMCMNGLINIKGGNPYPEIDQLLYDIKHGFMSAMDDDLNISAAMASIFKIVKQINILIQRKNIDENGSIKILETFKNIDQVLNIFDFSDKFSDPQIKSLIEKRNKARKEKDWALADKIRDQLLSLGISIRDMKLE